MTRLGQHEVNQRSQRHMPEDAALTDLLAASEIVVNRHSASAQSWGATLPMSANAHLDHTPHLCVADDGTVLLAWISNPSDHIRGSATEPNALWYARFDGNTWNPPVPFAQGIGAIMKSDLAYNGTQGIYVFSGDMDDDLTTEADQELFYLTYDGGVWSAPVQLTQDALKDTNPDVEYTEPGVMMLWYRDGQIVQAIDPPEEQHVLEELKTLLHPMIPEQTRLLPNYPNPFNPETWIPYQLAGDAPVTITLYDTLGHLVRTLELGTQQAGSYTSPERAAHWDGRNHLDEPVSSGVYLYHMRAGDYSAVRRLVIVK